MTTIVLALQDPGGLAGFEGSWRSLTALLIVFGLLALLAWLARRGSLPGAFTRRTTTAMRIEGALPLGDRRSLVVVDVEGRRLVIGMSPASVSLIAELPVRPFDSTLQSAVSRGERDVR